MPSRGEEATAGASIPIGCPWPQAPAPHRLNESGEERSPEQAASPDRRRAQPQPESSVWSKKFVTAPHQGGLMELKSKEQPSSPQKQGVKARSKSTEEIQPAKKAFHTPQKSLPNQMDEVESKGSCPVSAPNITQQQQT